MSLHRILVEGQHDNPVSVRDHADGQIEPLLAGIAAIGKLLWHAHTYGADEVEADDVGSIGWLLSTLAHQVEDLRDLEYGASKQAHEREAAAAVVVRAVPAARSKRRARK